MGQYAEEYTAEKALDVFRDRDDQARPLTVGDLDDVLEWSPRTIHNKLEELENDDLLRSRRVGARGKIWWAPLPREDAPLVSMGLLAVNTPSTVDEVLAQAGEDIPGRTDEKRRERAAAVLTAYEFLQQHAEVSAEEIRERTYADHLLEPGTEKQSGEQQQWILYLRDALAELPGVEAGGRGQHRWQYIDPDGSLATRLDVRIDTEVRNNVEPTAGGKTRERQLALAQLAYEHLKKVEKAGKRDFEEILPEYTAQYSGFEGLWSYFLKDALKSMPGVAHETEGQRAMFKFVEEANKSNKG
jgi:hypothetical protein